MKKLYQVLSLLVILIFVGLAAGGCGSDKVEKESTETKEPYKIGVITTLSGPLATVGIDYKDGVQVAVDQINAAGGIDGHQLELIVQDDGSDPGKAVSAFTKLARQDNVLAVTGMNFGHIETAVRPIAEREKVLSIIARPIVPQLRARNDKYSFNIASNEYVRIAAWLEMLEDKGWTRVVGLNQNDELSTLSLDFMKQEGAKRGISVEILPDLINVEAVDVTPQIIKLKDLVNKTNAQAIILTIWPPNLGGVLKTMQQLGINLPVIEYDGAADPTLFMMGGPELNGLILNGAKILAGEALPDSEPVKKPLLAFAKSFQDKIGRPIGNISAAGFDATNMIAKALKESGADREKLREAVENIKGFVGVSGVFTFSPDDHEGLPLDTEAVYVIKDQKFVYQKSISGKFDVR